MCVCGSLWFCLVIFSLVAASSTGSIITEERKPHECALIAYSKWWSGTAAVSFRSIPNNNDLSRRAAPCECLCLRNKYYYKLMENPSSSSSASSAAASSSLDSEGVNQWAEIGTKQPMQWGNMYTTQFLLVVRTTQVCVKWTTAYKKCNKKWKRGNCVAAIQQTNFCLRW